MPPLSLEDILYGAGRYARKATTIGGDPDAVASVRAGEKLMDDESAANRVAFTPDSRDALVPPLSAAIQGYRGSSRPEARPDTGIAAAARSPLPPRVSTERPTGIAAAAEQLAAMKAEAPEGRKPDASTTSAAIARFGGAYSPSPNWGISVAASQLAKDEEARQGIRQRNAAALGDIDFNDRARGNPMDDAIAARRKTLEYEDLLPANAISRVAAQFGKSGWDPALQRSDVGGDYSGTEPGMPTMGEARQNRSLIAQAQAKQNPKDVAEGALGIGRGRIAEELNLLRDQLDEHVSRARGTPNEAKAQAQADEQWQRALTQAKALAEILKPTFPPPNPYEVPPPPAPISGK